MFGMEKLGTGRECHAEAGGRSGSGEGNIHRREVRYLFAGDLLGQLIATSLRYGRSGNSAVSAFTEPALPWERRWAWGPCA